MYLMSSASSWSSLPCDTITSVIFSDLTHFFFSASDNVARSLVGSAHVPQFLCYFLGPDYDSLVALVKGLARLCLEGGTTKS